MRNTKQTIATTKKAADPAEDDADAPDDWPDAHDDEDGEEAGESDGERSREPREAAAKMDGEKDERVSERLTAAQRRFALRFDETRHLVVDLGEIGKSPSDAFKMVRFSVEAEVGLPGADRWRPVKATKLKPQSKPNR